MSHDNLDLSTLRGQVESVLASTPKTRDSDILLTLTIWRKFYPNSFIEPVKGAGLYVRAHDMFDILPREDNVKRVRAQIQNDEKRFPPTSEEVALKRGWLQLDWQKALGYYPNPTTLF